MLFDPFAFLRREPVKSVAAPRTHFNEDVVDEGDFGSVSWFILLASHVDDRTALRAVDGWGGDAYVTYEAKDRTCVRIRFGGDTPTDVDEMAGALDQWGRAFPASAVKVTRDGDAVELDTCDAGDAVPRAGAESQPGPRRPRVTNRVRDRVAQAEGA